MQKYGYGERNERGERLLEFALKQDMLICNTQFQQPDCRKWTWRSPDGKHKNMIDMIMIDRRWKTSVRLCRTFQGADISSDHSLVLCNLNLKLKHGPRKQTEKKRNLESLEKEEIRKQFQKEFDDRLNQEGMTKLSADKKVMQLNKIIKDAVKATIPLTVQPKIKWITQNTLQLAKEKREKRLKRHESEVKEAQYKQLCNKVRTSARKDKQDWLDNKYSYIEQSMGEYRTKEVYKLIQSTNRKWKPK